MPEKYDDVIREYIDFVNAQVGVHMDALAGFENIKLKIERQVHRENRPVGVKLNERGEHITVYASYEDPSKPDIILSRIIRANDYVARNAKGGSNESQQSQSAIVFLFTVWEHEIRPRLKAASKSPHEKIVSDIMGDLNQVRHAILHDKGIMLTNKHSKLKLTAHIFKPNEFVSPSYDQMHEIFVLVKNDMARLMFDCIGRDKIPFDVKNVQSIAIHKRFK
jgi:hypothetical protein